MRNPELAGVTTEDAKKSGRERVPVFAALDAQKKLVLYMTPPRLKPYIDLDNDYDTFMEALMLRYMNMYDSGDYNGFAEYCDVNQNDQAFMYRVINQELTEDDLEKMKQSLVSHGGGVPFFASDEEVEAFIKVNTH